MIGTPEAAGAAEQIGQFLRARIRQPVLWLGGAQGAGKSTLAWALAHEHDLPLHSVDLWAYRLGLVIGDVRARGLGEIPAMVAHHAP